MRKYRALTSEEIEVLEKNDCWAEDWSSVQVADGFLPKSCHRVIFYGDIRLGTYEKDVEITKGFMKHTGIRNATLRNVTIGDNCLIENIGNYINNYIIGNDCYVSNVSTMETVEGANYGEGNLISVLNEVGDGNLVLFKDLNSQLAAFEVKHLHDKELRDAISKMVQEDVKDNTPAVGIIGKGVRIINTKEIVNTLIEDGNEVNGASRLSEVTIASIPGAPVYIGTGVILENCIISEACKIVNSVKMQDCFVGEACHISNGFTANQSVFFANSYMSNGEACAAFCGPFSASHHKSSLLIGGMFSFYNAGSSTNFSNHAYKMGPMHWGTLERGTKTASGCYLLMPATIGTFSVCFGKLMHHPNTRNLPFSYLIAYGETMYLVPGRNITPVGYNFHDYVIQNSSLKKGIKYYDIALRIYMGAVLKRVQKSHRFGCPVGAVGEGDWNDLAGLLLPDSEEQRLIADIKNGTLKTIQQVIHRFREINDNYRDYQWAWTYRMILDYYGITEITPADAERIRQDYVTARRAWIAEIRKDAEKEFKLGDIEPEVLADFLDKLDHEIDFEN